MRSSNVPRSSFVDAKRRLYEAGVLRDRYVPNPRALGTRSVRFALARPFGEDLASTVAEREEDPRCVLLWSGSGFVLSVSFLRAAPRPAPEAPAPPESEGRSTVIDADVAHPTVPCFFDALGWWAPAVGLGAAWDYPRPLGRPPRWGRQGAGSPRLTQAVTDLVRRPFAVDEGTRAPHLNGPQNLPRSQRLALDQGLVDWRVVLGLREVALAAPEHVADLVLLTGHLRSGARAPDVFRALVVRGGIHPFLFVTDGARVLVGAVAGPPRDRREAGQVAPRPSALALLTPLLTQIETVREPARDLKVVLDHRYDRLVAD